ncbi:1-deoxy-D-xylulose-5-phosphate reductoisomerase [Propylenella binzhouense]|uniref:1-deoxy-D-xylulose 5-phosphate reductoisomerase n=1 Tax=Propylenella binzhouense TaxID=2555902 RepID=A0A964T4G7_9HYPH|nr:1-deoxy-D-xylulose-5-phosphate reductoisomerase [Propylenella binzhouense]MYZ47729.1 1-deoxy-D-xylulose-5-phosphate reductoisomerase [Propylenella binzhouense]
MRRVSLLGATGSVGTSAAEVLAADPGRFAVHLVTARNDAAGLAAAARRLRAERAVIADPAALPALREALAGTSTEAAGGPDALEEAAGERVDIVLSAIVGAAGLRPTAAAVRAGNAIALANKECLVCAGSAFMALARRHGATVLPVDSEHNALFQLLEGRDPADIASFTITASGGPFRGWDAGRLAAATPAEALAHPTWSMGPKISIDSATLMNKGLELIEAHHLFAIPPERLDVIVHPQSVVHGLVTFRDGSVHAEIGAPDMKRPIAFCLYWPQRARTTASRLDLVKVGRLAFEDPDEGRFPALRLAREALRTGQGAPTVLNAANEIAVASFLAGGIGFPGIAELVERTLADADRSGLLVDPGSIDDAIALDREARERAERTLDKVLAVAS